MAAGAAPAPVKKETKSEVAEMPRRQPATLWQRIEQVLHEIFQGREESAGWRQ